jgi:hypothetical protein
MAGGKGPLMTSETKDAVVPVYEHLLRQDRSWAMDEGDRHFRKESDVFRALRKVTRRLEELGIPYAVAGAMALDAHGFRRLTIDVDILVRRDALQVIHEKLEGLGYVPPFTGSKNLRDTEYGVRIEFLVAGEYPGDGRPKPVAFPDPAQVGVEIEGVRYLSLPKLVELKIASGMTNPGRLKDLGDVQETIRYLDLPVEFAEQLDPYVRERYTELWAGVKQSPRGPVEG